MTLLWIPQPIAPAVVCGWCGVRPGDQHSVECPERDDPSDWPAFCARCGVTYSTNCDCDRGDDE